jgi:DNA uptake protein ComE-like DNA-binding protein
MIWKDFFFFSGSQRTGIVVLFVLIVLSVGIHKMLPVIVPSGMPEIENPAFSEEVRLFQRSLYRTDSLKRKRYTDRYPDDRRTYYQTANPNQYAARNKINFTETHAVNQVPELFPFDPNTLDSAGLRQLGIPPRVVTGILRYRRKGGVFYTPERFSEVYGLSPDLFTILQPYIRIDSSRTYDLHPAALMADPNSKFALNTVDSVAMMQIKGMNKSLVRSILHFRRSSGGFASIDQLRELYGMTDDLFSKLSSRFVVDSAAIQKIKINSASVDKLNAHPYLNFYQSRAIYEYRRRKGKIISIRELQKLDELDPLTIQKMEVYFSFE